MTHSTRDQSVFNAIADPTRREILGMLTEQPLAVEEIASHFAISRPAISKHLRALLEAGLVRREPKGRMNIYRADPEPLGTVRDWVNQIWRDRLLLLKRLAEGGLMIEDISQSIDINAPIERVWQVLTSEGLVEEWLGCMGYKAEIGRVFYMQQDGAKRAAGDTTGATHCELIALDQPQRMVFSWYYPDMPKTEVAITLAASGAGTRVELLHSGWDQFDGDQVKAIRDALAGGWGSYVLPQLKRVAEGGEAALY